MNYNLYICCAKEDLEVAVEIKLFIESHVPMCLCKINKVVEGNFAYKQDIDEAQWVLLLISEHSMCSRVVCDEIEYAQNSKDVLCINVGEDDSPQFANWYEDGKDILLDFIRRKQRDWEQRHSLNYLCAGCKGMTFDPFETISEGKLRRAGSVGWELERNVHCRDSGWDDVNNMADIETDIQFPSFDSADRSFSLGESADESCAWMDNIFGIETPELGNGSSDSCVVRVDTGWFGDPELGIKIPMIQAEDSTIEPPVPLPSPKVKQDEDVNTCVFAPGEVCRGDQMLVQVFLYLDTEDGKVKAKAEMIDEDAVLRNSEVLSKPIHLGDMVSISLFVKGADVDCGTKSITWMGKMSSCSFGVCVPKDSPFCTLLGTISLSVRGIPIGEMMFKTRVKEKPNTSVFAETTAKALRSAFISYSHKDALTVNKIVEGFRIMRAEYFLDRDSLETGERYRDRIEDAIRRVDKFVLCWSQNAAESVEVGKELDLALALAPEKGDTFVHPIVIAPKAALPKHISDTINYTEFKDDW